jgi:hypothetical protein
VKLFFAILMVLPHKYTVQYSLYSMKRDART